MFRLMPGRLLYGHIMPATVDLPAAVRFVLSTEEASSRISVPTRRTVAILGAARVARPAVRGSPGARGLPYGAVSPHGIWAAATLVPVPVVALTART
jgi:hypothetical protein